MLRNGRCVTEKRRTCALHCSDMASKSKQMARKYVSVLRGCSAIRDFSLHYKINLRYTDILALCVTHTLPLEVLSDPSVCTGQVGGHVDENDSQAASLGP